MHWRTQQNFGKALVMAFAAAIALLWLITPVRNLITEKLLGNIALSRENGFDERFGAFPELVKDQGGSTPVPLEADTPLRLPQYRGLAWLQSQDAKAYTLQVMSLSDERAVGNFLSTRQDRDQFVYFKLPELPDPAMPDAPGAVRFVISYGNFATRGEAEEVAAALAGLSGGVLPRTWGSYQAIYAAMPEPVPVQVLPPGAGAAPPDSGVPQPEAPPVSALPMPGAHETASPPL